MAVTHEEARRAQMKAVVEAYFEGIAKQDMSAVPYDDNVLLRSPLAPGGLSTPLLGRQAVFDWFASLWPVLGGTEVFEHYFNDDLTVIATRADIVITHPPSRLRVTDRFMITPEGKIIQQENHYDPKGGPTDLKTAF
jgi:hypothetical protein